MRLRFPLAVFLLFCLFLQKVSAQQAQIDSLLALKTEQNSVRNADILLQLAGKYWRISQEQTRHYSHEALAMAQELKNDSLYAKAALKLSSCYMFVSLDSSRAFAQQVLQTGDSSEYTEQKIGALQNIGVCYFNQGKKRKSLEYYQKAFDLSTQSGLNKKQALIISNMGVAYKELGDYNKAVDCLLQSVDLRLEADDKTGLAFSYHMLGVVFKEWENYNEAEKYFQKSLDIKTQIGDKYGTIFSMTAFGELNDQVKNYEKALEYYIQAEKLSAEVGNTRMQSGAWNNMAQLFDKQGDYDKALMYYTKTLKVYSQLNDYSGLLHLYENMGLLYYHRKEYKKARNILQQGMQLLEEGKTDEVNWKLFLLLSDVELAMGNNRVAMDLYKQGVQNKDSVFKLEKHKQFTEMQNRFEAEKKDIELENLSRLNAISQQRLKQQKRGIILLSTGMLILFLLLILVVFYYQQRRKAYQQLAQKNLEIAQANSKPYQNSALGNEKEDELIKGLIHSFEQEKCYLKLDLNSNDLARELQTNTKYLSQVINSHYQSNFSGLVNKYRIQEAQVLLANPDYHKYTIESIAEKVGYRSKATFNTAFKKLSGMTPSEYKRGIQE